MNDKRQYLGEHYQALYSGYYHDSSAISLKRELSASQTVSCMMDVVDRDLAEVNRILDVGAGDGSVLLRLSEAWLDCEMSAVEISESGVESIKAKGIPLLRDVRLFDGYHIPYPDKYFDLAIAIHVLEHVEHERLFIHELCRVARHLYVEVPLELGFKIRRSVEVGKKFGHINFYSKETLKSILESTGVDIIASGAISPSSEYEQLLYGRRAGKIKNIIRSRALTIAPDLAPWFMTYNGYAYCKCG